MTDHPGARLDEVIAGERRQALRALLRRPLLSAAGASSAEFGLVRRHAGWLREWLARHPGWMLQIDGETARLRKTPADLADATRPAREPGTGAPFSRRRYVILCLALAALERADRQTALGRLADDVVALASADPALAAAGMSFTLTGQDQRRDVVHVMRFLLDLRVLVRVHGDEQQYLSGRGDVLYNVNRPALAAMLNVRRGPSTIDEPALDRRLEALVDEPVPDTDDGRNRRLRSRLTRRLLDDPVVYYDALTGDERAYLSSQRAFVVGQIEEATGLVPEIRREGIAMVDEPGDLTDLGLPEEGTEGHLTLLLAEHLAGCARRDGPVAVGHAALRRHVAGLIARYRVYWRKDAGEPGAENALTEQTIERLEALRLVRRTDDGVVPLSGLGRYAIDPDAEVVMADLLGEQPSEP
ncbi:MAG TPA: TIGR02678 family protein [Candidatus Limnocylindria bacterium]|nr:TIGR02678 family protein [Candidatus Limnocylindria bacterium]